ncbi:MAG: hypothetical protein HY791_05750 [Deltaproteobacteria bacterium]|nr:hypothetical protein [Deltaproteobacteria bacterium]
MTSLAASFERGELEGLAARVDDQYLDAIGDEARLLRDFEELLARYDRRELRLFDLEEDSGSRTTIIRGRLELKVMGQSSPREIRAIGPLAVELTRSGRVVGGWLSELRDVDELLRVAATSTTSLPSAAFHPTVTARPIDAIRGPVDFIRLEWLPKDALRAALDVRDHDAFAGRRVRRFGLLKSAGRFRIETGF